MERSVSATSKKNRAMNDSVTALSIAKINIKLFNV